MLTIENDLLKISVSKKGAELQSLYDKEKEKEWLWQADPLYWGKKSPVLFPFIGQTKAGHYTHEGKLYAMTKHGFARDLSFELEYINEQTGIRCLLMSSERTLKQYPFAFKFQMDYILEGKRLIVRHEVINENDVAMYFSLGGHPAFDCHEGSAPWTLTFPEDENLLRREVNLESGLMSEGVSNLPLRAHELALEADLFSRDALVLESLKSSYIDLKSSSGEALRFHRGAFPTLAIWSVPGPFVCLEPWFGGADDETHSGVLAEKRGVIALEPKEVFRADYVVELF